MNKIVLSIFLVLISSCTTVGVNQTALFENEYPGNEYLIIVSGHRALMAHDPISAIVNQTYETQCHFRLKQMSGTVDVSKVQILQIDDFGSKKRAYLIENAKGRLVFSDDTLLIDIYVQNTLSQQNDLQPCYCNGQYNLIRAGSQ